MRERPRHAFWIALCLAATLSCDDDGAMMADDGSSGDPPAESSGENDSGNPLVEGIGVVRDLITGEAVRDAEVCLFMEYDIGCVFSDASGAFSLPPLPSQALRATQVSKQGHSPIIMWFTVPTQTWAHAVQLVPQAVTDALVDGLGEGLDTSRGHVVVRAVDGSGSPVVGATIELASSPDSVPAFLDSDGLHDVALSATGDNGIAVVPNLAEGAVDVTVLDASGSPCSPSAMAEAADDNPAATRLRVLAGHWAAAPGVDFVCG